MLTYYDACVFYWPVLTMWNLDVVTILRDIKKHKNRWNNTKMVSLVRKCMCNYLFYLGKKTTTNVLPYSCRLKAANNLQYTVKKTLLKILRLTALTYTLTTEREFYVSIYFGVYIQCPTCFFSGNNDVSYITNKTLLI